MATETPTTSILTTRIDPTSARFEANMRYMADLVSAVRRNRYAKAAAPKRSKASTPKAA